MSSAVSARDIAGSMNPALEITDVRPQGARNSVFYRQRSELQSCNMYGIKKSYIVAVADNGFIITINCDFAKQKITLSL
jgi:hypothetical protein